MINFNPNNISALAQGANSASGSSPVRTTFDSIMNGFSTRPLQAMKVQPFSSLSSPRSLAQQVFADTLSRPV